MLQAVLEETGEELTLLAGKFRGSSKTERSWYLFITAAVISKVKSPL